MVKICAICGCEYEAVGNRRYCSEECSKAAIRKRNRQYYRVNREAVLFRHKKWLWNNYDKYLSRQKSCWRNGL